MKSNLFKLTTYFQTILTGIWNLLKVLQRYKVVRFYLESILNSTSRIFWIFPNHALAFILSPLHRVYPLCLEYFNWSFWMSKWCSLFNNLTFFSLSLLPFIMKIFHTFSPFCCCSVLHANHCVSTSVTVFSWPGPGESRESPSISIDHSSLASQSEREGIMQWSELQSLRGPKLRKPASSSANRERQ